MSADKHVKAAKYAAMPKGAWDGIAMIYSMVRDEFYSDPGEAFLEDGDTCESLQLVICKPVYARKIDLDFFCDDLPEDGDWHSLPAQVANAVDAFNKAISGAPPLSWVPGNLALDYAVAEGRAMR